MLREAQGRLADVEQMLAASAAAYPDILSLGVVHGIYLHESGRADEAEAICRRAVGNELFRRQREPAPPCWRSGGADSSTA